MSYAALEPVEPPATRDVTHGAPSSPVKGGGEVEQVAGFLRVPALTPTAKIFARNFVPKLIHGLSARVILPLDYSA